MSADMTTEELKRLAENIMPGPWKIADFWGSGMLEICPDYPHPSGGEWADIAQVNDLGDTYDDASQYPDTPVLAQANARAIALVPALLHELIERREADAPVTAREAETTSGTEREAFDFAMRVYKETGVTPELRRVYDFYKNTQNERQPSETVVRVIDAVMKWENKLVRSDDDLKERNAAFAALRSLKGADQ